MTNQYANLSQPAEGIKGDARQPDSVFGKTISSGLWVFLGNICNRLFGFVRTMVLAWLLSPDDFGLFGVAMLALSTLDQFTKTGMEEALIQKKENIEKFLNVGWTINVVRSLLLFVIILTFSPYIALFFKNMQAEPIIKTISAIFILNGLSNVGIIYFKKDLSFKKIFLLKFSGNASDFIVAIPMALLLKNVWAMVCGLLVGHFVRLVVSYRIHPYRPVFCFDYQAAKELFKFGGWLFGIGIVAFLSSQGDDMYVGRVLGTTYLGYYYMAFLISNLPATEMSWLISGVTFPAYSKFQDNIKRMKESYLRVLQMTAFISIPMGVGILLVAPEFTDLFLGEKWTPIILPLQILALSGIISSIVATGGSLFFASGQPRIEFTIQCVRFLTLAVAIYPLTLRWDIKGTALAVALSSAATMPVWLYKSIGVNKAEPGEYIKPLLPTIASSAVMFAGVIILKKVLTDIHILGFAFIILFGVSLYIGMIYLMGKVFKKGPLEEVKAIISLI